ncbi:sensor histidine kinase [Schumannella luteola]
MARRKPWSVAGRVFGVQVLGVLAITAVLLGVLAIDARRSADDDAAATSLSVARTIAADPAVAEALASADPTATLQPYALATIRSTHVDFVTIMDPTGTRYTHPDPEQIGKKFLGTITAAQRGEELTETFVGTLGPSVRAVVPVMQDGALVGIVSAGVTTEAVSASLVPRIPFVIAIAVAVLALGSAAAAITRRSLRRVTGDLAAEDLERMVSFYRSVLHSVREGVVLTDRTGAVVLYNDEAADLLGLPAPASGASVATRPEDLGVDPVIAELLTSGRRVVEETHVAAERVLLVNQEPTDAPREPGRHAAVMTLRDQSRLQTLVGELQSVRSLTDALRSQAHEHANTLHTVLSLVELGRTDEAAELIVDSARTSQELVEAVAAPDADPVLVALLIGKAADASERGIDLETQLSGGVRLPLSPREIVGVVGNLVDNALDAALAGESPRRVRVEVASVGASVEIAVEDSGAGPDPALADSLFDLGVTSRRDGAGHGIGLAVVRRIVEGHGGTVGFTGTRPTRIVVTLPRRDG